MAISQEDAEFQAGVQELPDGRAHAYFQIVPRGNDPIGNPHDLELCASKTEAEQWLRKTAADNGFKKIVWGLRRPE
jgi:hypothetical protein